MCVKFRQFQNNSRVLTSSCLTISGVPVDDLIVAFCAHSIFSKSQKMA